jgi:hypothetical protein
MLPGLCIGSRIFAAAVMLQSGGMRLHAFTLQESIVPAS